MTTARAWSEETEADIARRREQRLERERRSRERALRAHERRARREGRSLVVQLALGIGDVVDEWWTGR